MSKSRVPSIATSAAGLFTCVAVLMLTSNVAAQELEPRAYSASPVGTTFVVLAFGRSDGAIGFDPSIPVTDVHAEIFSPVLGLGRTFGIAGRQALATAVLPYAFGEVSGAVGPQLQPANITRSGLGDFRAKLSINLHGSPALTREQFMRERRRTYLLGTSVIIQAPTGQYDPTKLINLGTNRWAVKPELGFSYPVRKFYLDVYGGAWMFTENASFFPGQNTRQQDPLFTVQAHVSYNVRTHLWLALDGTWYEGAGAHLNHGPETGRQNNSRLGLTCSLPLYKNQSLKIAYSNGVSSRTGSNFSIVSVSWQLLWFDRDKHR